MRVKVGDQWFEAEQDRPIMVELTDLDLSNIRSMPGHYYSEYKNQALGTFEELFKWMREGGKEPYHSDTLIMP